jgi:pyruvate kinase
MVFDTKYSAMLDGATATMLSNETAVGSYPVQTVALMCRAVDEAQRHTKHTLKSFKLTFNLLKNLANI